MSICLFMLHPSIAQSHTRNKEIDKSLERYDKYFSTSYNHTRKRERAREIDTTIARIKKYLDFSIGYRQDNLKWNIAGNLEGESPNILSELTWEDIEIMQFKLKGQAHLTEQLYIRSNVAYGMIMGGENQDSDYLGDNRTAEFSRSSSTADEGSTVDTSLGLGYRIPLPKYKLSVSPLVGYSMHRQNLNMKNGDQEIDTVTNITGPFGGLESTYDTQWIGPWTGVDIDYSPFKRFSLLGSFEYHWADYEAVANWNLRSDFQHPKSFEHLTDGTGVLASLSGRYTVTDTVSIDANVSYQDWATNYGIDRTFFSSGAVVETRLNEVTWDSLAAMISVSINW